jgi:hypothetical protein
VEAAAIDESTDLETLSNLDLLVHDVDAADISCDVSELVPGSVAIAISANYQATTMELTAVTASGSSSSNATFGYKSPETAGEFMRSSACELRTFHVPEGGGAGLITYSCPGAAALTTPDRVCLAQGALYVKDCNR